MSFDGGARHNAGGQETHGSRAAGAGAALWGPPDDAGRRPCVAQLALSLPSIHDSMTAEALGCRAALALARLIPVAAPSLTVVGDNLPVVRLGATNGRVRMETAGPAVEPALLHAVAQR